jgi:type IV pilus assembly protein PilC
MAEFVIRIADDRGKVMEKAESGYSATEIRDRYQQSGYLVYWVKPRGLISGGELRLPQRRKVKLEEFIIFNQQFLTLVRAGLPIVQALELLSKRQSNQYFRMLLEDVRDRTKSGDLLSAAFEKQGAFPKLYSTTLMAGEKSGSPYPRLAARVGRDAAGYREVAGPPRRRVARALVVRSDRTVAGGAAYSDRGINQPAFWRWPN